MILRRLSEAISEQNWVTVLLEIFIVVVGIFIGLQVDGWNEARKDRALEREYLVRLKADLEDNLKQFARGDFLANVRIGQINLVFAVAGNPELAKQRPGEFVRSIEKASWSSFTEISGNTYNELTSTGRTPLIRSIPLRAGLADYYRRYENWQKILAEDNLQRDRYSEDIVGLLNFDQMKEVQDAAAVAEWDEADSKISPSDAYAVAMKLAARDGATKWLPGVYSHHLSVLSVDAELSGDAQRIIDQIDELLK